MSRIVIGIIFMHVAIYGAAFMRSLGEGISNAFFAVNFVVGTVFLLTGIVRFMTVSR